MLPVIGPVALRKWRFCQSVVNFRNLNNIPWDKTPHFQKIKFEKNAFAELQFFKTNLRYLNYRPFRIIKPPGILGKTDASDFSIGGFIQFKDDFLQSRGILPTNLISTDSNERELYGVWFLLESFKYQLTNSRLILGIDNQNVVKACTNGTTNMRLHLWSDKIMDLQLQYMIDIDFIWIRRKYNELADSLSKVQEYDDYEITPEFFGKNFNFISKSIF